MKLFIDLQRVSFQICIIYLQAELQRMQYFSYDSSDSEASSFQHEVLVLVSM